MIVKLVKMIIMEGMMIMSKMIERNIIKLLTKHWIKTICRPTMANLHHISKILLLPPYSARFKNIIFRQMHTKILSTLLRIQKIINYDDLPKNFKGTLRQRRSLESEVWLKDEFQIITTSQISKKSFCNV